MRETTLLGAAHRNAVWVSNLTGARYRWTEFGWEFAFKDSAVWHPAHPTGRQDSDVHAHAGETFVEER